MEDKRVFVNVRVSEKMKERINSAFEQEGIDWTSLAKSVIYNFVKQVESGEKPNLEDQKYRDLDDQAKTKYLQIQLTPRLKERFDEALKKTNLSAANVVLPYLIRITVETEQKQLKK